MYVNNGAWTVSVSDSPDLGSGVWFYPPEVKAACTPFNSIKSIPNPDACTMMSASVATTLGTASRTLFPGHDSINVLTGIDGNVGWPDTNLSSYPRVYVENALDQNHLWNVRDVNTRYTAMTDEAFSFSCPGWTQKFSTSSTVAGGSAKEVIVHSTSTAPFTQVLVPNGGDSNVCFLTGLGGPWGGWSRYAQQPSARIHTDPLTKDIMLTLSASGAPAPSNTQSLEARVACIDLSP
jgi:hypothetical protein